MADKKKEKHPSYEQGRLRDRKIKPLQVEPFTSAWFARILRKLHAVPPTPDVERDEKPS